MKLLDRTLEKKALKLVTQGTPGSHFLLASLSPDSFATKACSEAYRRIAHVARAKTEVPTWDDLLHDPTLSESTRSALAAYGKKVKADRETSKRILKNLEAYRKMRLLYTGLRDAGEALQRESVDADKVAEKLGELAVKVRSKGEAIKRFAIGVGNNSAQLVKDILKGSALTAIPTGFKVFDRKNRGIFLGSLFVLGATTGGGKTAVALQLMRNFADHGARVCIVSLEMTEGEVMVRNLSAYSRIEIGKLIHPESMTPDEKSKVERAYAKRVKGLKAKDAAEVINVPTEDLSIDEVLFSLKSFGYDVIIIDYISLLKGADGDEQWKQLGNIARFSKIFAKNNNCIVCLLAQIGAEGVIRYSKAVQEHANNAWYWVRDQKSKDTHILRIQQMKARNQEDFPFELLEEFKYMTVRDVPADYKPPETSEGSNSGGSMDAPRARGKGKGNSGGRHKDEPKFKKKVLDDEDEYFSDRGDDL